ncbi:UNVERIFIED_CONTAM: hypothetical protein Slati_2997000 [Sesamum latifolium]|uniref:Reverse transcriptase n=1 Tax=Sesamum latifolium TaxID=2727402 RepID=A0AAW2VJ35_9LAMI
MIKPPKVLSQIQIDTSLSHEEEEKLKRFLESNQGVLEWEEGSAAGIDERVIKHKLNVRKDIKPVRQKKRNFRSERDQVIHEEVQRLLKLGYIREVYYPEWIANVMLVPKTGWGAMAYVFTNLNKAYPKDSYLLPRIDLLVDSTSGCERLSMLDAYQGYNQITLAKKNQEKTSFITE